MHRLVNIIQKCAVWCMYVCIYDYIAGMCQERLIVWPRRHVFRSELQTFPA